MTEPPQAYGEYATEGDIRRHIEKGVPLKVTCPACLVLLDMLLSE